MIEPLAIRLKPGQDLKKELDHLVNNKKIDAAFVITCVGSLTKAVLRLANQPDTTEFEGKFEIVSLTGTLSRHGSHYHISLSDGTGKTIGGHLWEGCTIYTTAEIVLGVLPDTVFAREIDPQTTYDELVIRKKQ